MQQRYPARFGDSEFAPIGAYAPSPGTAGRQYCDDVPHISDLAGLLAGVKPVVYLDITDEDLGYIDRLCAALKLVCLQPEAELGITGFHQNPRSRMLLLGRERKTLKAAAGAWGRNPLDIDWGVLLGYPKCCVTAYRSWALARFRLPSFDIVRQTWANSVGHGPYSFMLNNVFNFFSRCAAPALHDSDRQSCLAIHRRNERLSLHTLNVITWHPCSFHCAESLAKGEAIWSFTLDCAQ